MTTQRRRPYAAAVLFLSFLAVSCAVPTLDTDNAESAPNDAEPNDAVPAGDIDVTVAGEEKLNARLPNGDSVSLGVSDGLTCVLVRDTVGFEEWCVDDSNAVTSSDGSTWLFSDDPGMTIAILNQAAAIPGNVESTPASIDATVVVSNEAWLVYYPAGPGPEAVVLSQPDGASERFELPAGTDGPDPTIIAWASGLD